MPMNTPLARVTLGLAAAVVLAGIALFAANRAERLTNDDVVGVYRVEPTDPGNATDQILFQRFTADGRTWLEAVRLVDGPAGLESTVSIDSAHVGRWSMDDDRLCIGDRARPACSSVARDPVTGDLTVGPQRLTRLRGTTLVD